MVVVVKAVFMQLCNHRLGLFHNVVFGPISYESQRLGVFCEETVVLHQLIQLVDMFLVEVAEDILTKLFDVSDNIPRTVVLDIVGDILTNPFEHLRVLVEVVDEFIHRHLFYLLIIQVDAQVRREIQLSGQISHHALKEGINRLNTEIVVIVYQMGEGNTGAFDNRFLAQSRFIHHLLEIAV